MKENDLTHGQFTNWVENQGIYIREAQRMMKVASELPNTTTLSHLGTKALVLTRILSARRLQLLKIFQTSQRWEILE
ncbi:hypothetical protein [Streptococcus salivarius]|uniref:hypothetical protein n=1 Tax=Streptococcus salivarius TaxID=1304 RepID=UPI001E59218A|nr:hypothetical protein [Streptococcus salivarius]